MIKLKELSVDLKNYKDNGSVFKRTAVRGIVEHNGKFLIIHSKYGDYKFPGGGKHSNESLIDTLCREVREETGYTVKLNSIREYLLVTEKRKGDPDDLMEMTSYYYFCDVEDKLGERDMDDYEKEYDYEVAWMTLEEIIKKNECIKNSDNIPWVIRELTVMKELSQMLENQHTVE